MTSAVTPRNTGESGMPSTRKPGSRSSASAIVSCPRARAASTSTPGAFEKWTKGVPVGERWRRDDALSVLDSSTGKPADGAVEKILVLIQLHEVLARAGPRHDVI